ncbi:MAG: DUF1345 domain-containing protein [Dermabacter sp.]|nr:DUF1345 domain-containing protein [Dermabacter sp.]
MSTSSPTDPPRGNDEDERSAETAPPSAPATPVQAAAGSDTAEPGPSAQPSPAPSQAPASRPRGPVHRFLESELRRLAIASTIGVVTGVGLFSNDLSSAYAKLGEVTWITHLEDIITGALMPAAFSAWIVQGFLYLVLSIIVHRRMNSEEFLAHTQSSHRAHRWWWTLFGAGSAESWTISGSLLAAALVIAAAQIGYFDGTAAPMVLGFGAVGTSWAIMVYSFALRYADVYGSGELSVPFTERPRLGDFISISVLTSTFLGAGAQPRSSTAAKVFRSHAVLAWAFNTVILAMAVSILFGSLTK